MKKLGIIVAITLLISLTACTSKDETQANQNGDNNTSSETTSTETTSGDNSDVVVEDTESTSNTELTASQISNIEDFTIEKKSDLSELVLRTMNDDILKISNYKKKVVFLNFFSTT